MRTPIPGRAALAATVLALGALLLSAARQPSAAPRNAAAPSQQSFFASMLAAATDLGPVAPGRSCRCCSYCAIRRPRGRPPI